MIELSKNKKKLFASLKYPKYRQKYNIYLVEGEKIAHTIFQNSEELVVHIIATNHWAEANPAICKKYSDRMIIAGAKDIKELSTFRTSPEIILVVKMIEQKLNYSLINKSKSIYLHDVQDPGNVGTIIRTADWFGIPNVIRSKNSADFYNPKTLQASMGSFARLALHTASFEELVENSSVDLFAADMAGQNIDTVQVPSEFVLILGNEGSGLDQEILSKTFPIKIPGKESRVAESLNVSIAAGILCFALCK